MADRSRSNVVKMRRPRFSIGSIIFLLILLYIVFYSVSFFNKKHITIYEVNEKQISDNSTTIGIAVRSEEVYNAPANGYIGFYNSKGSKVAKGAIAFSIDPNGTMNNQIADIENNSDITSYDVKAIQSDISNYRNDFDFSDYSSVYDFKYNVESDVLSYISSISYTELTRDIDNSSFSLTNAVNSGVIAYWTDSLDGITADNITSSSFNQENYTKNIYKTSDSVNQGDPVCKVITSEDWSIVIKLDPEQYAKLESQKNVMIRFCKDGIRLERPFRLFSSGDDNFAEIFMSDYMSRYIDDRYIKVELMVNSAEGLKIPMSSLVDKSCYIIPRAYLHKGDDTSSEIISYIVPNETSDNGTVTSKSFNTFAKVDEEYVYVDAVLLKPGTSIKKPDSCKEDVEDEFHLGEMKTLKGVYNVNKGFCQFKQVDILYENKEYCIVRNHTDYGLQVYDHIVVNPELINENDIIY